ncbi:unnamed protein product [Rotaria sp. Silwood1]|nr:unnamed protein product [Rotaria sp. Silwood1]CAF5141812.1 unnamed protein product [Rotaria sp. Silwood1]
MSTVTKTTPYEVMFGQTPRSDSDYWKLVSKNGIDDENDLPTPVAVSTDYLNDGKSDTLINVDEDLDLEVIELVKKLSDDIVSSLNAEPSISSSVTSQKHDIIRKTATDHYLATANKKMKLYQNG